MPPFPMGTSFTVYIEICILSLRLGLLILLFYLLEAFLNVGFFWSFLVLVTFFLHLCGTAFRILCCFGSRLGALLGGIVGFRLWGIGFVIDFQFQHNRIRFSFA